jgi:hypothetical protein
MGMDVGSDCAGYTAEIEINVKIDSHVNDPFQYAFTNDRTPVYLFNKSLKIVAFNHELIKKNEQLEELIKEHSGNSIISVKLLSPNLNPIRIDGIRKVEYIPPSKLTDILQAHSLHF